MKGFVQRLITAILFVAVMLGGLFGGLPSFLLLFAIVGVLSLWEFSGIVLNDGKHTGLRIFGIFFGLFPYLLLATGRLGLEIPLWVYSLFIGGVFLGFIYELLRQTAHPFHHTGYLFAGAVYIGGPVTLLLTDAFFTVEGYSPYLIFSMLLLVWSSDTGAYLVGSLIGKTPLAPKISPKKTWEGTVGGWVFSMLISIALFYIFKGDLLELWQFMILALICGVFGTLGDLVESTFKRSYGIKDSGNLLPGHGGMLDRFDAFFLVVPYVYIFLSLV